MQLSLFRRITTRNSWIQPARTRLTCGASAASAWGWLGALIAAVPLAGANPRIEAVSVANAPLTPSVSAAGDSFALSVTPDGAFVLFASTANHLLVSGRSQGFVDLYVSCRTNGGVSLVSANAAGTGGGHGNSFYGSVTPNGRYVVFQSDADDLTPLHVNQAGDIFVRDLVAGTTRLVSVNRQGAAGGNRGSSSPVITPDGRFVAFVSDANDLVAGDDNGIPDVFVRDLQQGVTVLVSPGAQYGYRGSDSASDSPVITPDGRFVAFTSTASNLVSGAQATYQEIYVRDLVQGQTLWASQSIGATSPPSSYNPALSDDGRYVAFKISTRAGFTVARCTLATLSLEVISTTAAGHDPLGSDDYGPAMSPDGRFVVFSDAVSANGTSSVWLWDGQTKSTSLVSANSSGQPSVNGICDSAALTPDGRYVAFVSNGTDLNSHAVDGEFQVYLRDMRSGTTELASGNADGTGAGALGGTVPALSSDGRFVLFESRGDALVSDDLNHAYDVFLRDLTTSTTELISRAATNPPALTANAASLTANNAVSADGRYVVFESSAGNLVSGDTNGWRDVFVRDLQLGSNILVSVNQLGTGGAHGTSGSASISANGRYVVFISSADDLTPKDTNGLDDIFVRDLLTGTTRLVSVSIKGFSANRASTSPSMSADGRLVAFLSSASDLAPTGAPMPSYIVNVFLRDLVAETTRRASQKSFQALDTPVLLGADGRFVAYQQYPATEYPDLRVTDLQTTTYRSLGTNVPAKAFSGDGRKLAYIEIVSSSQANSLVVADLVQGTNTRVPLGLGKLSSRQAVSANADGRWVAISTRAPLVGPGTNALENIFICDVLNANLTLASLNHSGTGGGNGTSGSPRLSSDGRYVAFRSAATDLVAGGDHGLEFLFDRLTGRTTLLSGTLDGVSSAPGTSLGLEITPDGKKVVFSSVASDLVSGDFNGAADVFTRDIEPATPTTETPVIRLTDALQQAGLTTIRWTATPGRSYRVEYKDSLVASGWQDLPGVVMIVGSTAWITDNSRANAPQRYYRVRLAE